MNNKHSQTIKKKKQQRGKKRGPSWEVWFMLIFVVAVGIGVLWTNKHFYSV